MSAVREILETGVASRIFPGAEAVISVGQGAPLCVTTGAHTYEDDARAVSPRTLFDIASLTKVLVTTTAILQLASRNRLHLSDPLGPYLLPFHKDGKSKITLFHLLTHTSGLEADIDHRHCATGHDLWNMIEDIPLLSPPGTKYVYSDLGFLLLGRIVEHVSGSDLSAYADAHIFSRLGMERTKYTPPREWWPETAPTEYKAPGREELLQGRVHDEKASLLGGVAGHAGVFSTGEDIHRFMRSLLNCLTDDDDFVLPREYAQAMTQNQTPTLSIEQGLGWFLNRPFLGDLPPGAFGHTGFTGVSIAASPIHSLICILLTNCVHPKRPDAQSRQRLNACRAQIAHLALRLT